MRRLSARVKHYFGMDLPERTLPLHFNLPKVSGRFKATSTGDDELLRNLDEAKNTPLEYFRLLLAEIKHINRCTMKPRQRLMLTRQILKLYYPTALAQLAKQAKNGGVPDPEDRKQLLDMLVEIAQIMLLSYQILFAGYYGGSNYRYARSRNLVRECASRILELLVLKQHAKSLRYQVLNDQDWQLANTIFYVMNCYEDVEQPLPTLSKELGSGGKKGDLSLREQYALLQTVAKFDMLRWPTHLQWVIESYFHGVANAVQVRADDGSAKLGRNDLIAYCHDGNPARGSRLDTPHGPALILGFGGLAEAIRKDCMGLFQAKKNNTPSLMPPRFARLPETEHFVISDQLVRGLENTNGDTAVEKEQKVSDLRIFVGFSEVFNLLQHKQGRFGMEDRLADVLAKRSALIAEDHVATEKSMWFLLLQNEKMTRLSTQETSFTTPMAIGSLLAYGLGEDINRPGFAVVSRIFRPSHKVVIIDLQRIAGYAEPVMMTVNASEQGASLNQPKPALLMYDLQRLGGWGLMFPPRDIMPGIDKITISRNRQTIDVSIGNMRNATDDFYLFATSLTSKQLGIEGQPDYAVPPTQKNHPAGWLL